jgi:TonB family protein
VVSGREAPNMGRTLVVSILILLSGCGKQQMQPPPGDTVSGLEEITAVPRVVGVDEPIPESPPLSVILQGPVLTPFTSYPRVLNRDEVLQARDREYSGKLDAAGLRGTVRVWFLLDDEGQVLSRVLQESSGYEDLDAAGLRVAQVFRFSAALNRGAPVFVWVSLPIRFDPGSWP